MARRTVSALFVATRWRCPCCQRLGDSVRQGTAAGGCGVLLGPSMEFTASRLLPRHLAGKMLSKVQGVAELDRSAVMSHYEILGVPRDATQQQITRAYRALALQYHPDCGGAEQKMVTLNLAYEIIGRASERALYDKLLEACDEAAGPARVEPELRAPTTSPSARKRARTLLLEMALRVFDSLLTAAASGLTFAFSSQWLALMLAYAAAFLV